MALVKCADCGKDVSDVAPACPHCGRPIAVAAAPAPSASPHPLKATGFEAAGCLYPAIFLAVILVAVIIFA